MDWFERVTGFAEGPYSETQARLRVEDGHLTRLGGGAFGNDEAWINDALLRALRLARDWDLEVCLVSYGPPVPATQALLDAWRAAQGS